MIKIINITFFKNQYKNIYLTIKELLKTDCNKEVEKMKIEGLNLKGKRNNDPKCAPHYLAEQRMMRDWTVCKSCSSSEKLEIPTENLIVFSI